MPQMVDTSCDLDPKRCLVEHTLGGLNHSRYLSRDDNLLTENSQALIRIMGLLVGIFQLEPV
jgi:hypothetical protein